MSSRTAISSISDLPPRSDVRRIIVADAQVPFVEGGAELHVRSLIEQLRRRGYEVDKVAIPFRGQPKSEILAQAAAWRLLDLSSNNLAPVDLLIATDLLSEGLNLQDASVVVHLDLPWTAARLTQRIGRVWRVGAGGA